MNQPSSTGPSNWRNDPDDLPVPEQATQPNGGEREDATPVEPALTPDGYEPL